MQNEAGHEIAMAMVLLALATGCSEGGAGNSGPAKGQRASADASEPAGPCPHGTLDGSYAIMTTKDAAAIATCTEISKDLTVGGDTVAALSLPKLQAIGGTLNVKEAAALTHFELPSLVSIGKELTVSANPVLSTFSVPVLESSGTLLVTNNPELQDFDLGALTKVDFVGAQGNDVLTNFELPKVSSIGTFVINLNPGLVTIRFDSLAIITGDGFIILKNPMLTTLAMPMLETLIGDIAINDNPMLPSCQVDALVAQLGDPSVAVAATGNDDSATCP